LGYAHLFPAYERRSRLVKAGTDLPLDDLEANPQLSEKFA
jgi:hypothetical protein